MQFSIDGSLRMQIQHDPTLGADLSSVLPIEGRGVSTTSEDKSGIQLSSSAAGVDLHTPLQACLIRGTKRKVAEWVRTDDVNQSSTLFEDRLIKKR